MEKQTLRVIQAKIDEMENRLKNPRENLKYIKLKRLQHQAYIEYAKSVVAELKNKPTLTPEQKRRKKSCEDFLKKENVDETLL